MYKAIRITLTLAALSAAVASQALTLNYAGNGAKGSGNTLSLGNLGDDFGFDKSVGVTGTGNVLTLSNTMGTNGFTILLGADQDASPLRYSGTGTATGFGTFAGLGGTDLSIVSNDLVSYVVSVQGTIEAVPEPTSIAALSVGAVALLRRRKKA